MSEYAGPHFYQPSPSAGWQPIDASLVPTAGRAGWFQSKANSWSAAFGPAGATGGAERLTIGSTTVGFTPRNVTNAAQTPTVSGSTAKYANAWPHVDITEQVMSAGVNEDLVLTAPGSASSFAFTLSGATARPNAGGGLDLMSGGRPIGTVPSVSVTAGGKNRTAGSGARMTVAGDTVEVGVSPQWLAGLPSSAFPVVIDPTFEQLGQNTQFYSVSDTGPFVNNTMQIGIDSGGVIWDSAVLITPPTLPAPMPGSPGWHLIRTTLDADCTPSCFISDLNIYNDFTTGMPNYGTIPSGRLVYAPDETFLGIAGDVTSAFTFTGGSTATWLGIVANTSGGPGSMVTLDPSLLRVDFEYWER